MGLFHKNKKFPKYPKGSSLPNLPKYESQTEEYYKPDQSHKPIHPILKEKEHMPKLKFKEDLDDSYPTLPKMPELHEDLDLPIRRPEKFELRSMEEHEEPKMDFPRERSPEKVYSSPVQDSGPIFVKLDDYKKAVKNISFIRDKLDDAEDLLADIMDIKKEEDQQLADWHREITEIKNKLLEVDKELFEVHR